MGLSFVSPLDIEGLKLEVFVVKPLAGDEPTAAEAGTTHAHHTEATTEGLHDEDLQLQSYDNHRTDEA